MSNGARVAAAISLSISLAGGAETPPAAENPTGLGLIGSYRQRWGKGSLVREGGSEATEEAVRAALEWLRRHQNPDGSWSCYDYMARCDKEKGPCRIHAKNPDPAGGDGRGWKEHDIGVTALAVLAFTGYGHTHRDGVYPEYVDVLNRALQYLKSVQITGTGDPNYDGAFRRKESIPSDKSKERETDEEQEWMYDHAIATLAMAELLFMSADVSLKSCVEEAAKFCLRAQLEGSGWRYSIKSEVPDTSVTGWMALALRAVKTCRILGSVSQPSGEELDRAIRGALAWFDAVTSKDSGITGYRAPGDQGSMLTELSKVKDGYPFSKDLSCMTAVSVLCRLQGRESRSKEQIKKGTFVLIKYPPKWQLREGKTPSTVNFYYWFFGTHAMFQYGGGLWKEWNDSLQKALLPNQRRFDDAKEGWCEDGSWDPIDEWSHAGGRVYTTALGALTLQVYYRYERTEEEKGVGVRQAARSPATDDDIAAIRDVIRRLIEAARRDDTSAAGPLVDKQGLVILKQLDDVREIAAFGLDAAKVQLITRKGELALAVAFVNVPTGKEKGTKAVVFTMVKEGSRWLIRDIDLEDADGLAEEIKRFDGAHSRAGGADGLPAASCLNFRVALTRGRAKPFDLEDLEAGLGRLVAELESQGPESLRTSGEPYGWYATRPGTALPEAAITGAYDGRTYVLLSRSPGDTLRALPVEFEFRGRPDGQTLVRLKLDSEAGMLMGALTAANQGRPLAILVGDMVISIPTIHSVIRAWVELSGTFTSEAIDEMWSKLSPIKAKVAAVKDDLAVISAGSEDGVRVGMYFTVSRGHDSIGTVRITRVYRDMAGGEIAEQAGGQKIQEGDEASPR